MNEHEHDDAYLWSGQGTSEDVAALERSLAPLRWRPQPLALPSEEATAAANEVGEVGEVAKLEDARQRRGAEVERASANWWPAVAAGLVAAAAVLALLLWPKGDAAVRDPAPTVNPIAPPTSSDSQTSPDLKDPFGPRDPAGSTAPISEPEPEGAPSVSPDLVNPFADPSDAPARRKPKAPYDRSSDLKDPFEHSQSEQERADELVDPFGDRDDRPSAEADLKDPFSR